jgi:putative endonuclease
MTDGTYYVYILTNASRTLYIGVTNSLERRLYQHRMKSASSFASKYNVTMLIYYEAFERPADAIAREKQLKRWSRAKKVALVDSLNPDWVDLSAGWFDARE